MVPEGVMDVLWSDTNEKYLKVLNVVFFFNFALFWASIDRVKFYDTLGCCLTGKVGLCVTK